MPARRRYPKRTRKRTSRRRKPRRVIPALNYGRAVCISVTPIQLAVGESAVNLVIMHQNGAQAGASPPTNSSWIDFSGTGRMQAVKDNWDQYAVTAVKYEWMPLFNSLAYGATGNAITNMFVVNDLDSAQSIVNENDANLMMRAGFKSVTPTRPLRRFHSAKRISV